MKPPLLFLPLWANLTVPLLAAGAIATAVAVPLLIHLLHKQRVRVVEWAAMRFLQLAEKRHHRRLDEWLLLAARIGVLLLPLLGMLAVAPWAEDFWQRIRPGAIETLANAPRTHYVLVLDGTLSMNARHEGKTRFEESIAQAEKVLQSANPGDGFTLVYLAGAPQL
ncbi:MAG: BatA domain-containing protein, partial [Gemmataceae bacterium]